MPRCAVSIASATPNPWRHRCSRKPIVASQSMRPSGNAATWAAAYTVRLTGGGYEDCQPGSGTSSMPDRPGRAIRALISDRQVRDHQALALGGRSHGQHGQLHASGAFGQVPPELLAAGRGRQELLPLRLEAVVEGLIIRDVRPHVVIAARVAENGMPYGHRG